MKQGGRSLRDVILQHYQTGESCEALLKRAGLKPAQLRAFRGEARADLGAALHRVLTDSEVSQRVRARLAAERPGDPEVAQWDVTMKVDESKASPALSAGAVLDMIPTATSGAVISGRTGARVGLQRVAILSVLAATLGGSSYALLHRAKSPPPPPLAERGLRAAEIARIDRVKEVEARCSEGEKQACLHLARELETAPSVYRNKARALQLYKNLCHEGESLACHNAALQLWEGSPKDEPGAYALLTRACELRNYASCTLVGHFLREGIGVAQDQAAARVAYQKACHGDADGCWNAALSFRDSHDPRMQYEMLMTGCREFHDDAACQGADRVVLR